MKKQNKKSTSIVQWMIFTNLASIVVVGIILTIMCGVFIYENLIIPDFVVLQTNKLMMSVEKFLMFHQKIINYYAKI